VFRVDVQTEIQMDRQTEGMADRPTDITKLRIAFFCCSMTAPINECICCRRSVTEKCVLDKQNT
jgi:hypothetical protein